MHRARVKVLSTKLHFILLSSLRTLLTPLSLETKFTQLSSLLNPLSSSLLTPLSFTPKTAFTGLPSLLTSHFTHSLYLQKQFTDLSYPHSALSHFSISSLSSSLSLSLSSSASVSLYISLSPSFSMSESSGGTFDI